MIRKRHNFNTLADLYGYAVEKHSKREASQYIDGSQHYTYAEFDETCRRISRLLANFGIMPYNKVAIFSQNMPNWTVAFFAITAFGRIAVPMLTDLSANEITNILSHSDSRALFVSKKLLPKVPKEALENIAVVICTDDLSVLMINNNDYTCDGQIATPREDDIATIIYTSGTTGAAKGVMLSHRNLCANVQEAWHAHKVYRKDTFLSILPMAHAYEMSIGMLYPFSQGSKVYYISKPPTPTVLVSALADIRPTTMLSVPLVIEKIYRSSVAPTIAKSPTLTWLKEHMPWLLYWIVGSKVKKVFGGKIKFFGIGGAKLDPEVETFLHRARFPYAIGYGLTETAPLICDAAPFKTKVGSTGKPSHGVQVRLENVNPETGEGELVAKGDNVMRGYYKDYNRTLEVLTPDGWFHTGDLAYCDDKGRYYIKGRMGSVIVGASGENIYPEEIESVINGIEGINESLIVERQGQLVALVHFQESVLDWNFEGEEKFLHSVEEKKQQVLDYVNSHVNKNSQVKEVKVQKEEFSKTATKKIRRFLYKDKDEVNPNAIAEETPEEPTETSTDNNDNKQ
ncbi:MAG: AMP-binding protein [Bacteroidales bacterium]|nr:AMP-binding protein [Bacteroidales bacterium]